jgi:hypothetical protein
MVYGPIAAFLVEMFPVKIRYTSMSLPYHVGNGILEVTSCYFNLFCDKRLRPSGVLPEGLWYPIVIAAVSFVVGMVYIKIKIKRSRIKTQL